MLPGMLDTLKIRNLAIVENLSVDFRDGLNVITGETGAGKSIVVGALGLVLGDRADKSMIRSGQTQCAVEAVFRLAESSDVDAVLERLGLPPCEDGTLIVRRIVSASGAGKNLVNDSSATLQALRAVGDVLVDMHGPHDHQSLLNPAFQLDILDAFGHLWKSRSDYEESYRTLADLRLQRQELQGHDQDVAREIDMLGFEIKEIEDAQIQDIDEAELERDHTAVANAQRILELANLSQQALFEDEHSAFEALVSVQEALRELTSILPDAEAWLAEARSIAVQTQELSAAIASQAQRIEADPQRLQWIEARMEVLHRLKRKYGRSVKEILQRLETSRLRFAELESRETRLEELDRRIEKTRQETITAGQKLRLERAEAAAALERAVTSELVELGFPQSAFTIGLSEVPPGPTGLDRCDFSFAPNPGEPRHPLRAIASSGEISRVMLATKTVLAAHDRIPVLVFDEIDANVGGEMGHAIGRKLALVAQSHQVLCITHLPQVAVHGDAHLVVTKVVQDGRTHTHTALLADRERPREIARMLGGKDPTRITLQHAREMLSAP